jgi:hypothetical protein
MNRVLAGCALLLLAHPAAADELWWSLRPLKEPAVPEAVGPDATWVRNPLDAFVLAKLREKGLRPSPPAEPRTLIRRVTFDLTGLPPTPEEIEVFLKEWAAKPQSAYERLVDRLLASPAYGERWARHWMDAVHFAETHGHDQDRVRPNAWPYRDYLIAAFNADRPYARFVREQVAADALFPDRPELLPALGMLAAGPWDESSLRDIREDSIDRQVGYYLDRDDIVSTVIATFTSLTVHCARCHDHKFDPITQDDYYALQAVFAGVGRADRSYDSDPAAAKQRLALRAKRAALEKRDPKLAEELLALEAEVRAWEAKTPAAVAWTVLDPSAFSTAAGTTLTKLTDRSLLAGGPRPEKDVYTIAAATDLKGVTAVRLELLPDGSLPKRGPGRQDNGNLHLSEIKIKAAPREMPRQARACGIADATADFDQQGWTVRHAIDNQPATAWGIYPEVGKPHQAVFELAEPAGTGGGTLLTVVLEQNHGGGHLIGRLRLSVTTAPRPVRITKLPDTVASALAVPAEKRTGAQKIEIAAHYLKGKLEAELGKLPPPKMVYAAGHDFAPDGSHKPPAKPRPVHVLKRGDIHKPLQEAAPGAIACVRELPARFKLTDPDDEAARRAALARWLTDPKHPLTWRSAVNRVWHHHFGRGLVDTPNDFGKMGGRPTHPELLDWLAFTFREEGGSLKKLHKLIITSATYQQTSQLGIPLNPKSEIPNPQSLDVDNRYLWRMNRSRLDAEEVRDAVLLVSGRLDRRMGGPSDQQFAMKPGVHVTPVVEYPPFDWDRPAGHRRSVYRFVFRTLPDPFVACLDGADASQLTPARNVSVTPLQALALLNNEFILVHAKALAASLEKSSPDRARQVATACERVWGRPPAADELAELRAYADKHGLANLCRLLFNSNEFLFVN